MMAILMPDRCTCLSRPKSEHSQGKSSDKSRASDSECFSDFYRMPSQQRKVLTVDEIIRRRREESAKVDAEKNKADATYERIKLAVVAKVKASSISARFVYSAEITAFLLVQDTIRKKLGCARRREVDAGERVALVARRTVCATEALQYLKDVHLAYHVHFNKLSKQIKELATTILQELQLESSQYSREDRFEFFPQVLSTSNQSPEDVFRVFSCIEDALAVFESTSKEDWLKQVDRLSRLFGELAFIIAEQAKGSFVHDVVKRGIKSFESVLSARESWQGHLAIAYASCKTVLHTSMHRYLALKFDAEDNYRRKALAARCGLSVAKFDQCLEKNCAQRSRREQKLHFALKNFWTIEARRWSAQRHFIPEIYDSLYEEMRSDTELVLLSLDSMLDFEDIAELFTERSLRDYTDIDLSTDVGQHSDEISCSFNGKCCTLTRYNLTHLWGVTSLRKNLIMQRRLHQFSVPEVSAVFVDNGYCYVHWDGGQSWSSHIMEDKFTVSPACAVVMLHQMCRAVYEMHCSDVTHGDIRPTSWWVNAHSVPKLVGFQHASVDSQMMWLDHESVAEPSAFDPPELKAADPKRTDAGDVFRLGKCLAIIAGACKGSSDLNAQITSLVDKMTLSDPKKRLTSHDVLARSFQLLGLLQPEFDLLRYERGRLDAISQVLEKQKLDLYDAGAQAELNLEEATKQIAAIHEEEKSILGEQKSLIEYRHKLQSAEGGDALGPPRYWDDRSLSQSRSVVAISESSSLFQVFRHMLKTDEPKSLNRGRDVVERGDYSFLDLVGVWRVENSQLWTNYAVERQSIRKMMRERGIECPPFVLRERMRRAQRCLPGAEHMFSDINEVYLLHGTSGEALLSIVENGINERYTSVALFGKGSYFAEDAGKNDQYVRGDAKLGVVPELHRELFPEGGNYLFPKFPKKAYYLLLCRNIMGYPVRVICTNTRRRQMENIDFPGLPIFSTIDKRELGCIPGMDNPPVLHHSLVAEKGGDIVRFREMVQFHSARVYPEYIVCYTRR